MTIETKFNINDLLQHKFQRPIKDNPNSASAYEVIEIHCNLCYTTAQVFYECRAIHGIIIESRGDNLKKLYDLVDFGPGRPNQPNREYIRFREDELIVCDEKLKAMILAQ